MIESFNLLTNCISEPEIAIKEKLFTICRSVKELAPSANRVSLWLFNEAKDEIFCLMCLDANNEWSNGQVLTKEQFPQYFDFILENNVLSASDARHHDATACFNKAYFEPLNIFSLLDFIFHYQFRPTGIICCEREGDATQWSLEDVQVLKRVANITSMFFSEEIIAIQGGQTAILNALKLT